MYSQIESLLWLVLVSLRVKLACSLNFLKGLGTFLFDTKQKPPQILFKLALFKQS